MAAFDSITYDSLQIYKIDSLANDSIETVAIQPTIVLPNELKKPFLSNWSVIFILILLALIASVRISSNSYINFIINSVFNRQTALRLYRERVFNVLHPAFRLDIVYHLAMGLFLLHLEKYFFNLFFFTEPIAVLVNIALVFILMYGKLAIYHVNGFLFNCQSDVNEYAFYTKTGNRVLGIFLLPTAIIMFYLTGIWTEILMFIGISTILLFSAISLYKGIRIIAQKDFSIYYMILYLCCLEILPILIVWRILWSM